MTNGAHWSISRPEDTVGGVYVLCAVHGGSEEFEDAKMFGAAQELCGKAHLTGLRPSILMLSDSALGRLRRFALRFAPDFLPEAEKFYVPHWDFGWGDVTIVVSRGGRCESHPHDLILIAEDLPQAQAEAGMG
jgi:hypothetical protein